MRGSSIHQTAVVWPGAKIEDGAVIGPFSEIGCHAVIGRDAYVVGATVEGFIGERTKCWRYSHVMADARVGDDCQVCNGAIVLTDAIVGNRVDVQIGAGVARHAIVGSDVYIGPNVIFCNAKNPKRGARLDVITVCDGASIGANSSIMGGVTIGRNAVVGAGSVVTKDVEDGARVYGNPATVR